MKKQTILKTLILLIMVAVLFAIPTNVLATSDGALDIEFWEDQTTEQDTTTPETTTPETTTPETTTPETTTPNTQTPTKEETTLPNAGVAEDTMMVVATLVLGITAVFAFKKINEYSNI